MLSVEMLSDAYAECHYTEYRFDEIGIFSLLFQVMFMLSVVMLCVVMLSVDKCPSLFRELSTFLTLAIPLVVKLILFLKISLGDGLAPSSKTV